MMWPSRRQRKDCAAPRSLCWAAVAGAAAAVFVSTSVALAAFTSAATSAGMSLTTKRIFPGVRSAWPWDIRDASGGVAEVNASDPLSYSDGVTAATGRWSSSFSTTRFDDFDFNAGSPGGIPVSSATFNFTFAGQARDNACFYLEVRRASTNTLLGTHGSSGAPSACASGAQVATTVDISAEVTNTDIANDLRIRVYADESRSRAIRIELATVSITTPYVGTTVFAQRWDDEATGSPSVTLWAPYAADGRAYTSAANLSPTFLPTSYLKFTPNEAVPTGSVISSAQLQFAYKSATAGDQTCWYFEVYNGATLIGTHGSSVAPVSCNSTTSYVTDTVPLTELNTVSAANNVIIKAYLDNSGLRQASIDLVQLDLNYYLN